MFLVRKIFDVFIWLMFFGFFVLGGIIYATERTYPGDKLYPFKLKFEDFAMVTSKILNKQADFSMNLVVKRANELDKILSSKHSQEGLTRLNNQVESTADSILLISDPVEKKKAATKYIAKLTDVSTTLNEQHQVFVNNEGTNQSQEYSNPTVKVEPTAQINTGTITESINTINPTQIPKPTDNQNIEAIDEPSTTEVIANIEVAQGIVQETIEEMTEIANQDSPNEEGRGNSEENRKNNDNPNNGNNGNPKIKIQ